MLMIADNVGDIVVHAVEIKYVSLLGSATLLCLTSSDDIGSESEGIRNVVPARFANDLGRAGKVCVKSLVHTIGEDIKGLLYEATSNIEHLEVVADSCSLLKDTLSITYCLLVGIWVVSARSYVEADADGIKIKVFRQVQPSRCGVQTGAILGTQAAECHASQGISYGCGP